MVKQIFIAISLLITNNSYAQLWTLQACMDTAVSTHTSMRQIQLNQATTALNVKQSRYDYSPVVNGFAGHGFNFGRNLDPISNEFTQTQRQNSSFSLNGNLMLFNGFSRVYSSQLATLAYENQFYNKQIEARNIKLAVLTAYLQILFSGELIQVLESQLAYSKKQEERIKAMISVGQSTSYDLIEITSEIAQDELTNIQAINDRNLAIEQLQLTMQMEPQENFQIDSTHNIIYTDTSIFRSVNNLAEMAQVDNALAQAELSKKISGSNYLPSLMLSAGVGSGYSDSYFIQDPETGDLFLPSFSTQFEENIYQSVVLTLNIPIYNQNRNNISQQKNSIEIERIKLERDQLRWELKSTIAQLTTDMKNAAAELDAAALLLNLAEKDFKQAEERFNTGNISFTDFLFKKGRLFEAQSNAIQTKYNYFFKCKILTLYYG